MSETGLTPRQLEILKLRATGETLNRIALLLDLNLGTVQRYSGDMLRRLNVWTVAAAVVRAIQKGLIDAGEIEVLRREPIDNPPHP